MILYHRLDMHFSDNEKVNQFLTDIWELSNKKFEILLAIRALFLEASSELSEGVKYGGLVFEHDKKLLGGVFVYKNHISIEFSQGATLDDPHLVLEGNGKLRRHIKLQELADVKGKHCAFYIDQAIT